MSILHTLLIISPQPIDVSKFYQPGLHETMQPRRRRGWRGLQGGLRGGNEKASYGQNNDNRGTGEGSGGDTGEVTSNSDNASRTGTHNEDSVQVKNYII